MIEELFVPYNEAQALRELGFDELCLAFFKDDEFKIPNPHEPFKNSELPKWFVTTPLYQQAFKFFREKYGKNVLLFSDGFQWTFDIRWIEKDDLMQYPTRFYPAKEVDREMFDSYAAAELNSVQKLIEIVNKQKHD